MGIAHTGCKKHHHPRTKKREHATDIYTFSRAFSRKKVEYSLQDETIPMEIFVFLPNRKIDHKPAKTSIKDSEANVSGCLCLTWWESCLEDLLDLCRLEKAAAKGRERESLGPIGKRDVLQCAGRTRKREVFCIRQPVRFP